MCYMQGDVRDKLRRDARHADELHERSRHVLIAAAREGAAAGLSQREISEAIGRSQPEVSRLLRFRGRTPLGRAVASHRAEITTLLRSRGAQNVRIFGSVARGEDGTESDVDLLVDFVRAPGLFELARLESELSELIGAAVDVVPSNTLRPHLADTVHAEAIPL